MELIRKEVCHSAARSALDCVQLAAAVGSGNLLPALKGVFLLRTLRQSAAAGCGLDCGGGGLPQLKRFVFCSWSLMITMCLATIPAHAQWRLESESAKVDIGHGAWQVTKQVKGPKELELSLVFFDTKDAKACIIAQTTPHRFEARTLAQLAEAAGAIGACNGGYFTPEFGPSGLEIAQGVRAGGWQKDLPFGGVLCVRKGSLLLMPDSKFQLDESVTDLVQCCPLLVQEGAALHGIGGEDHVARSFVATNGSGRWLIGYCQRAALEDLAGALVTPSVLHEFRIQSALNLDGGPSSGLWWKPRVGEAQGVRPTTRVRNVIVVLPKQR